MERDKLLIVVLGGGDELFQVQEMGAALGVEVISLELEELVPQAHRPEIIVFDTESVSSVDEFEHLKRQWPEALFLALVGVGAGRFGMDLLEAGIWDVLLRPLDTKGSFPVVRRAVSHVWERHKNQVLRQRYAQIEAEGLSLDFDQRDGLVVVDHEDRVVFVNRVAEGLFPFGFEEGNALLTARHMLGHLRFVDLVEEVRGGRFQPYECVVKQGEERRYLRVLAKTEDATQGPLVVFMLRDIREEVAFHRRAQAAERLATVGQLSAAVANEIATPITVLRVALDDFGPMVSGVLSEREVHGAGYSLSGDILEELDRHISPGELRRTIAELRESVEQISHVVEGLQRFSREERAGQQRGSQLCKVLTEVVAMMRPRSWSRAFLRTRLEEVGGVRLSSPDLAQLAMNLLNNALDAFDKDNPQINTIELGCRPDGKRNAVLWVRDNGRGIELDDPGRLFEPFYTTKNGPGLGLGLAIARQIVISSGGAIWLENGPGETTFYCRLPRAQLAETSEIRPVTSLIVGSRVDLTPPWKSGEFDRSKANEEGLFLGRPTTSQHSRARLEQARAQLLRKVGDSKDSAGKNEEEES